MLEIKPLDLDDEAAVDAYTDVRLAEDPTSNRAWAIASLWEPNPDFSEVVRLVARRDGAGAGITSAGLLSGMNSRLAVGTITVHPEHRRQGVGTALLEALLPELRARGVDAFEGWGVTKGSAGELWASARGFRLAASRTLQRLTLTDATADATAPTGYRLEQWIGTTPEHLLASVAATRQSMHDSPGTDSARQEPEWTPQEVRADEAEARAAGVEQRVVVAVEETTGLVVALTDVPIHAGDSTDTFWGSTAVTPAHRGRGLGLAVKAHMVRWLRADRSELERVDTGTDAANTHMIRVNERLGFVTHREVVVVSRPC
ncbi:GNAT family N-acetyltransferase [Lentzea albida]|uniref:Acetyltransferase (GNAT) family protein n=1 Tax=Lentzea albida TaxID=65499 RepID=A0A1H9WPI3_9PSEU|nr:GNAT family N-acetyltransferase [Lentzea albida]SES35597.1 Acetyltransferase (GNAT) family protein [Lentzea albida]